MPAADVSTSMHAADGMASKVTAKKSSVFVWVACTMMRPTFHPSVSAMRSATCESPEKLPRSRQVLAGLSMSGLCFNCHMSPLLRVVILQQNFATEKVRYFKPPPVFHIS